MSESKIDIDTKLEFDEIVKLIKLSDKNMRAIYVSVGCANGTGIIKDGKMFVEPKFKQQYPIFLKELKTKYHDTKLHLILIDPCLEEIPFCVSDDSDENNFIRQDNPNLEIYIDKTSDTNVYVVRKYVSYIGTFDMKHEHYDIMEFLTELNKIAISDRSFLVFHDFSGRSVVGLAEHFDKDNDVAENLNHIIYGLAQRKNLGCYIDLTSDECKFAYSIIDNNITAFNPYFAIVNGVSFDSLKYDDSKTIEDLMLIKTHISNALCLFKKDILDNILTLCRRVALMNTNSEINITQQELKYYDKKYGANLNKFFDVGSSPQSLEEYVFEIFENEIKKLIQLCSLEITSEEVIKQIKMTKSPYNWIQTYRSIFDFFVND